MRLSIVQTIVLKELMESLRDRRTLFIMVFVPILLYPALILLITQVATIQQDELAAKPSRIGIAADEMPEQHPLIQHLKTNEDLQLTLVPPGAEDTIIGDDAEVDIVLEVEDWSAESDDASTTAVAVRFKSVEERSRLARSRIQEALATWSEEEVQQRLDRLGLPPSLADPVELESLDRSDEEQRGGFLLGAILPFLVLMTVFLGALYPAIDITAGEKERGSIQTLFSAPISTLEIVAGKYLAVLCIALISGMANLGSMALMFGYMGDSVLPGASVSLGPDVILALFVIIVLIAMFVAALVLGVAVLARDFKDGQNLTTPVMLLAIIPGTIAQLPGFELTPAMSWIPAVNVILLMKQVLVDGVQLDALFLVAASSLVYTMLALLFTSRIFGQESIIVGERGSFDLLAKPSSIRPKARPSIGEALAWVSVSFVLLFYVGTWVQEKHLLIGLAVTLWLVVLLPTLGVARYLKVDMRETFALRNPTVRGIGAAIILGLTAWLAVQSLEAWLIRPILPVPDAFVEAMKRLVKPPEGALGWTATILVMSVSPAICEEALFRGFLFSSLRDRVSGWTVVIVTSLLFGLFHLSIYRLFGTTVLGVVMGLLVWRTGSIWTSVLFHALNNAAALLISERIINAEGNLPVWASAVGFGGLALGLWIVMTIPVPDSEPDTQPDQAQ